MRSCQTEASKGSSMSGEEALPEGQAPSFMNGMKREREEPKVIDGFAGVLLSRTTCTRIYVEIEIFFFALFHRRFLT
jgi:hypothetical protein